MFTPLSDHVPSCNTKIPLQSYYPIENARVISISLQEGKESVLTNEPGNRRPSVKTSVETSKLEVHY